MNNISKLMLSAEEQQLISNTQWILTKRIILDKVNMLLGDLAEAQKTLIEQEKEWLPDPVSQSSAKISKGENYLQLPYLLLDYPRYFDTENIFAIRTMFWWGNFFSVTLHLSGRYKLLYQEIFLRKLKSAEQNIYICINENQWQHNFDADNYTAVQNLSVDELQQLVFEKQFVKLAVKFPLQQWDNMPTLLFGSFKEVIEMLRD